MDTGEGIIKKRNMQVRIAKKNNAGKDSKTRSMQVWIAKKNHTGKDIIKELIHACEDTAELTCIEVS